MLTTKGFTLIETLFVLFIISVLSMISMTFVIPSQSDQSMIQNISHVFYQAHLNAMKHKENTDIQVNKNQVIVTSQHFQKEYKLDSSVSLSQHQFSFNELGHIHRANTIYFYGNKKDYRFVFQIGSGSFYIE